MGRYRIELGSKDVMVHCDKVEDVLELHDRYHQDTAVHMAEDASVTVEAGDVGKATPLNGQAKLNHELKKEVNKRRGKMNLLAQNVMCVNEIMMKGKATVMELSAMLKRKPKAFGAVFFPTRKAAENLERPLEDFIKTTKSSKTGTTYHTTRSTGILLRELQAMEAASRSKG